MRRGHGGPQLPARETPLKRKGACLALDGSEDETEVDAKSRKPQPKKKKIAKGLCLTTFPGSWHAP